MGKKKIKLYVVEQIFDFRIYNDVKYYLIKWHGYSNALCTWEKSEKIPSLQFFQAIFEDNVKKYGTRFYEKENDPTPTLEEFIGLPSKNKTQDVIQELQEQIDTLKQEVNRLQKQQDEITKVQEQKKIEIPKEGLTTTKNSDIKQSKEGGFENGDKLDKIAQAAKVKETGVYMYYILWKKRPNGVTPKNKWVTSQYLQKYDLVSLCKYLKGKLQ